MPFPAHRRTHVLESMQQDVTSRDIQYARQLAKRKRTRVACTQCKIAKLKCSDFRPCKRCCSAKKLCHDGDSHVPSTSNQRPEPLPQPAGFPPDSSQHPMLHNYAHTRTSEGPDAPFYSTAFMQPSSRIEPYPWTRQNLPPSLMNRSFPEIHRSVTALLTNSLAYPPVLSHAAGLQSFHNVFSNYIHDPGSLVPYSHRQLFPLDSSAMTSTTLYLHV
jgi:hypothetical protein